LGLDQNASLARLSSIIDRKVELSRLSKKRDRKVELGETVVVNPVMPAALLPHYV